MLYTFLNITVSFGENIVNLKYLIGIFFLEVISLLKKYLSQNSDQGENTQKLRLYFNRRSCVFATLKKKKNWEIKEENPLLTR